LTLLYILILIIKIETIVVHFFKSLVASTYTSVDVRVKRNKNYKYQVAEEMNIFSPKRNGDYHSYQLMGPNGSAISGIPEKNGYEYFIFALERKIDPVSASEWNETYLEQLRIVFVNTSNLEEIIIKAFNTQPCVVSPRAVQLIADLQSLSVNMVQTFKYNKENVSEKLDNLAKQDNLVKAVFMATKYPRVEAAVDLFIVFLLQRLGFYDDRLFAFPQLPHTIH
jgi:hypothetical protein